MAKVNGVPGFTNFKKVNIQDTFLINGEPIGDAIATENVTVTGDWTFDNDVGFSGAIQLEDEGGTFQDVLLYDTATAPDTVVLSNPITNGDIDLQTNGTGEVLVNGVAIGGPVALANDEYITGEDTGATARDLIGVNTSDYTVIGDDALVGTILKSGTGDEVICQSDAVNVGLGFYNSGFGRRGFIGFAGNPDLTIENDQSGDDIVLLINNAPSQIRLTDNSIGDRIQISHGGRIRFFDAGGSYSFESTDYTAANNSAGMSIRDGNGTLRSAGFANSLAFTQNATTSPFTIKNQTRTIIKDDANAYTWTIDDFGTGNSTGQIWYGLNLGSAGAITIDTGGTEVLSWADGSTVTTGNRTIAVGGWFKLYRRGTDDYIITGQGIT